MGRGAKTDRGVLALAETSPTGADALQASFEHLRASFLSDAAEDAQSRFFGRYVVVGRTGALRWYRRTFSPADVRTWATHALYTLGETVESCYQVHETEVHVLSTNMRLTEHHALEREEALRHTRRRRYLRKLDAKTDLRIENGGGPTARFIVVTKWLHMGNETLRTQFSNWEELRGSLQRLTYDPQRAVQEVFDLDTNRPLTISPKWSLVSTDVMRWNSTTHRLVVLQAA